MKQGTQDVVDETIGFLLLGAVIAAVPVGAIIGSAMKDAADANAARTGTITNLTPQRCDILSVRLKDGFQAAATNPQLKATIKRDAANGTKVHLDTVQKPIPQACREPIRVIKGSNGRTTYTVSAQSANIVMGVTPANR